MKALAFIFLISCIWDTVKAIRTVDIGRRERGIEISNLSFHWYMARKIGISLLLNLVAAGFFIVYLVG